MVPEKIHSIIFSGSNAIACHNNEWKEFLVGKESGEGFSEVKEEDFSSTSSGVIELVTTHLSGDICNNPL